MHIRGICCLLKLKVIYRVLITKSTFLNKYCHWLVGMKIRILTTPRSAFAHDLYSDGNINLLNKLLPRNKNMLTLLLYD